MSDVRLTKFGQEAVNAAMSGLTKIRFESLRTSDSPIIIGRIEYDPATVKFKTYDGLTNNKQRANISAIAHDETMSKIVVSGTFSNEYLAEAYDIAAVGLYATCEGDYSESTSRLFAYKTFLETPDHMPLPTDLPTSFTYEFNSKVSDESIINVIIEPGTYASAVDFQNLTNLVHANEPQTITVRCNQTTPSAERENYNYVQSVSIQGITDMHKPFIEVSAGTYTGTVRAETYENELKLWFSTQPSSSVYLQIVLLKTYA